MIKVSIINILTSSQAFNKIMDSDAIPASLGFKLVNALREIKANMESYDKLQTKIGEAHSMKDKDGKPQQVPGHPGMIPLDEAGQKELQELQATTFDLNLDKFKLPEGVKLSPKDLMVLDWLITE